MSVKNKSRKEILIQKCESIPHLKLLSQTLKRHRFSDVEIEQISKWVENVIEITKTDQKGVVGENNRNKR